MLQFLADKVGAGALFISQLLLTVVVGTEPYFQDVVLEVSGDRLFCSGRLVESFTPDLNLLLQSGDTVIIHFEVDLVSTTNDSVVARANWEHQFRYSLLEDNYYVYRSEHDRQEQFYNFEQAKREWVKIENAFFSRMRVMDDDKAYFLRISAFMEEMDMPGITKKINLMSFWNRVRPVHVSEPFKKTQLIL
ncbi:MAG: DUF4390 domain-containing protein [Candidatus Marinimicrobia bacterium]|nr:DUF4390 domain-containing protein [Candidatus Neomarinimicrobiota bacterium]